MTNDQVKEFFRKERERVAASVQKSLDEHPLEAGRYNVQIEGVRTFAPLWLNFDGQKWSDLDSLLPMAGGDHSKISYFALASVEAEPTIARKPKM